MTSVGDLFAPEPEQWGLRGDKYLWRELRELLSETPFPSTRVKLERLLEEAFWNSTGHTLSLSAMFHVSKFAHGGMSSGGIDASFWRENGFPLIVKRYTEKGEN